MTAPCKWDLRFLALAAHISRWSKDPSTQCGAVIVDDQRRIVSTGYNGLPQGVDNESDYLEGPREWKLAVVLHAENNAILFAQRPLHDCTMYVWPMQPCLHCASLIVQSGLKCVVTTDKRPERWEENFQRSYAMLMQAEIPVHRFTLAQLPPLDFDPYIPI